MKKLLWVGDAGCPSGFARATHGILETVAQKYNTTVLGINYRGDPHSYPYPIYAAYAGGDFLGVGRIIWMCDKVQPDIIVLQNDGWNIQSYLKFLKRFPDYARIPIVAAVAVDGKNFNASWLNNIEHAVFWTQFGLDEAREAGYTGSASVIPLGVDTEVYRPLDKMTARRAVLGDGFDEAFIYGTVNRNQARKRWDLTIRYFAEVAKSDPYAWLFLHIAPTGDTGFDVQKLAKYYGILERLILANPSPWYGVSEERLAETYNTFDVAITTTQGEGFGLTALEAMACGVPLIAPDHSSFGSLFQDAALLVPCTSTAVTVGISEPSAVIGGVPDEELFVKAMRDLSTQPDIYESYVRSALACANRPDFQWNRVGRAWNQVLDKVLAPVAEIV